MPNMTPALEQLTDRGPIEAHLADPQVLIFDPIHIVQRHAVPMGCKKPGSRSRSSCAPESKYNWVRLGWKAWPFPKKRRAHNSHDDPLSNYRTLFRRPGRDAGRLRHTLP